MANFNFATIRNSNYERSLISSRRKIGSETACSLSLPPFFVLCRRAWFPLRGLIDRALPFPWFMLHANYAHLHEDRSSSLQLDPPRRLTRACPPIGRDNPRDRDLLCRCCVVAVPRRDSNAVLNVLVNLFGWKFMWKFVTKGKAKGKERKMKIIIVFVFRFDRAN